MAKERKRKTLVYKHASFHLAGGLPLKQLLALALAKQPTIADRRESLGPSDESPEWRLIGQYRAETEFVFGVLMTYNPGAASPFVIEDGGAATLTVEQFVAPKTTDGKPRERLDGTLFFGVHGNHLVMMQSSSLREHQLESHLGWLLHRAVVLESTNSLRLGDQLPKATRDQLETRGVRELEIGGDLEAEERYEVAKSEVDYPAALPEAPGARAVALPNAHSASVLTTFGTGKTPSDTNAESSSLGVIAAIKNLLKPDEAAKLNLDALSGANIEYTLKIRYRSATSDSGQRLMNTLGLALRNAEGTTAKISLVGGGTIRGSELKLSGPVQITMIDGVPDANEVFEAMRRWMLEKVNSQDIQP